MTQQQTPQPAYVALEIVDRLLAHIGTVRQAGDQELADALLTEARCVIAARLSTDIKDLAMSDAIALAARGRVVVIVAQARREADLRVCRCGQPRRSVAHVARYVTGLAGHRFVAAD
jgi:hypothetical protein